MQISFSTTSFPDLDFQTAATLARQCGYDGVGLPASADAPSKSNALLTDPKKILQIFIDSGVEIAAIHAGSDLSELSPRILLAQQFGCSFVKLKPDQIFTRTDAVAPSMIDRLLSAAGIAADAGITLLIENQAMTAAAVRLWHLLDRLNHPSIGCCWNTLSAAHAKDSPTVAVPTLNSRIRAVELQDAKWNSNRLICCDPGDGELPLRKTTDRLRGIGFGGYFHIGFADAPVADLTQIEQKLAAARAVMQRWQILPATVTR